MNDKYTKTGRNAGVGFLFTAGSIVINAMLIPIIIKKYGVENWAIFAFFQVLVSIFTAVESSLQTFTQQKAATSIIAGYRYNPFKDVKTIKTAIFLLCVFAIYILPYWIVDLAKSSVFYIMSVIAFVNVFPRMLSSILKGVLLADVAQEKYYKVSTALNTLRPIVLLLSIVLFHVTPEQLAIVYFVFSLFEAAIYFIFWDRPRGSDVGLISHRLDHSLLLNLLIANVLSVLAVNLDKIAAYSGSNLLTAGNYNFSASIASLQFLFINVAIGSFTPRFKELFLRSREHEIRNTIYQLVIVNSAFIFAGTFSIFIVGGDLIRMSGIKIVEQEFFVTFFLLSSATFLNSNLWIPGAISNSCGKSYFNLITNLTSLISFLIAFFWLKFLRLSGGELYGASVLISAIVTTVLGLYFFKTNIFKVKVSHIFVMPAFKILLLTIVMLTPSIFWHEMLYKAFSLIAGLLVILIITIKLTSTKIEPNHYEEIN
ncbi:hypothetical protein LQR31_18325 [Chromobacterium vaccinii]|uniref:lipopolysaccharide biosynthesis protein n=1 Tax=Chromobacterium vaccinii TaxID=1108595 RepID=UPI001E3012F1|nr:hypothetical protein [Chromobacterium vaccinii]MCD4486435.1 hypothetical protein [Chromobacterium vaccinii]